MTTSGSVDFSVTGGQMVTASLRLLGVTPSGVSAAGDELADSVQALNMLLKQWAGMPGFVLWKRSRASLTLAAKVKYEFKISGGDLAINQPIEILNCNLKSGDTETTMREMSFLERERISDKTATGTPTKWFYEPQLAVGNFYIDVVPSTLTDTIEILYRGQVEDIDDSGNTFDLPQHWYRAIKYQLAIDIAPEYEGSELSPLVVAMARDSYTRAIGFSPETSDLYFQPGLD